MRSFQQIFNIIYLSSFLFLFQLFIPYVGAGSETAVNLEEEIKTLLEEGMDALSKRNYQVAETKYSKALELEDSCRVRWRRAKVYEITGRLEKQIEDTEKCYDHPSLGNEAVDRNITNYLKVCDVDKAQGIFTKLDPESKNLQPLKRKIQNVSDTIKSLRSFLSRHDLNDEDLRPDLKSSGIKQLEHLNQACPEFIPGTLALAEALFSVGRVQDSRKLFKQVSSKITNMYHNYPAIKGLDSENMSRRAYTGLIDSFAVFGETESLVKYLRSELSLDPDNPVMQKSWKRGLGAVAKCIQGIADPNDSNVAMRKEAIKCLELANEVRKDIRQQSNRIDSTYGIDGLTFIIYKSLVESNIKKGNRNLDRVFKKCVESYTGESRKTPLTSGQKESIAKLHENVYTFGDVACGCAAQIIANIADNWRGGEHSDEDKQEAERMANFITNTNEGYTDGSTRDNKEHTRSFRENIQRIQRLASQRDFYADLGVSKTATEKEIKKAYHRIALECHPDRFTEDKKDTPEAKKCEERFRQAAEAKEVLSDPKKRARFDSGEYFDGANGFPQDQQFHGDGGFPGGNFQFPFDFGNFGGAGGPKFTFRFKN